VTFLVEKGSMEIGGYMCHWYPSVLMYVSRDVLRRILAINEDVIFILISSLLNFDNIARPSYDISGQCDGGQSDEGVDSKCTGVGSHGGYGFIRAAITPVVLVVRAIPGLGPGAGLS
jgi:hypothetical protein